MSRAPSVPATRSPALAALVALLVLAVTGCRSSSSRPPSRPLSNTAAGSPDLARFIPADTPFAMFVERSMFDHPFRDTMNAEIGRKFGRLLVTAATAEVDGPGERFWREIARALGSFDDTSLRAAGWRHGRSELALYAVGLVPVMRFFVDGVKAEAVIRRSAASAGLEVTEARWHDRPYLSIAIDEEAGVHALIASSPDQLVVAVTADAAAVIDHVTSFEPPARASLASAWEVGAADRLIYLDPARLGALLGTAGELERLTGTDDDRPTLACLVAVGRSMESLPRTTATVYTDATTLGWNLVFDLSPDTAALFRGGSLPGWTTEPEVPAFRLGWGASPYPLLQRAEAYFESLAVAQTRCGSTDDGSIGELLTQLAPLKLVQGASFEMVALDGREVTMSLALAVRDLPALWSLIATSVPALGATVPATGDLRDLSSIGIPATVAVGRGLLIGSMGTGAERRARAMLAAAPGPAVPMLGRFDLAFFRPFQDGRYTFLGSPMAPDGDDGGVVADSLLDARLDGNHLVVRMVIGQSLGR